MFNELITQDTRYLMAFSAARGSGELQESHLRYAATQILECGQLVRRITHLREDREPHGQQQRDGHIACLLAMETTHRDLDGQWAQPHRRGTRERVQAEEGA